jgi:hypothetical protein
MNKFSKIALAAIVLLSLSTSVFADSGKGQKLYGKKLKTG